MDLLKRNYVVVVSTDPPKGHPNRIYQIIDRNKKRGIVVLINNVHFKKLDNRPGSNHDANNIIHTFKQIGYDVSYHDDLEEQVISNSYIFLT